MQPFIRERIYNRSLEMHSKFSRNVKYLDHFSVGVYQLFLLDNRFSIEPFTRNWHTDLESINLGTSQMANFAVFF